MRLAFYSLRFFTSVSDSLEDEEPEPDPLVQLDHEPDREPDEELEPEDEEEELAFLFFADFDGGLIEDVLFVVPLIGVAFLGVTFFYSIYVIQDNIGIPLRKVSSPPFQQKALWKCKFLPVLLASWAKGTQRYLGREVSLAQRL